MMRTCSDCPASISRKSAGRCKSCAMAAVNRTPEKRALVSAAMKARREDPQFMARMNAGRPKAHAQTRATRLSWCPPAYWETNAQLARKHVPLSERQRLIAEMIAHEGKRAVAAQILKMQRKHERELREAY